MSDDWTLWMWIAYFAALGIGAGAWGFWFGRVGFRLLDRLTDKWSRP